MGCGASSSVIEYAQVAPGGLGGLRRRGSASGEDEVEAFVARHLPTPVMDRLWVVHRQAMATSCIKEFMGLLGLRAKDMQGGMQVFLKLTKAPGIPLGKLEDMLRLPAGASGQPNPLAVRFFNAVASTSADGASQGLTYRTFMFFLAIFKHVPLAQPEKLRFWFTIMILANDPQADVNESAPIGVVVRFLRDVLLSRSGGFDSYLPKAPSKVLANVKNSLNKSGLSDLQFVDFATFAPMSAACNTTPILFEIFTRLETVFKATPKGADPYMQLKIRAHFFHRANELLELEDKLGAKEASEESVHKPSSWVHETQQVQHKSYLPKRDKVRQNTKGDDMALQDITNTSAGSFRELPRTQAQKVSRQAQKVSRQSNIVCSPVSKIEQDVGRASKSKANRSREASGMSRANSDSVNASNITGILDTSSSSSSQKPKSLFELEAFEKSLEYLSKVWEKDKRRAEKTKEAKRAFVQGRQSLPVVSEDDAGKVAAGGRPLIFSPLRAPKARASQACGAATSLAAAGCGWDVSSSIDRWQDPGANPWQQAAHASALAGVSMSPGRNTVLTTREFHGYDTPKGRSPTDPLGIREMSLSPLRAPSIGASPPQFARAHSFHASGLQTDSESEVPPDKPWLKRINAMQNIPA